MNLLKESWAWIRTQAVVVRARLSPLYDQRVEQLFIAILIIATLIVFVLFRTGRADLAVWVGGIAFFAAGVIGLYAPSERKTWVQQIAPELIGISIGVLAIDQLYQLRLEQQEKAALILQMGSPSNDLAIEAVRIMGSNGWVRDGSLKGANLYGANLKGAFLVGANLESTSLWGANLQDAILLNANLEGASLSGANFQDAWLSGVNFQDAILLNVNFQDATLDGANLESAIYNDKTVWPDGFDYRAVGTIHEDDATQHK